MFFGKSRSPAKVTRDIDAIQHELDGIAQAIRDVNKRAARNIEIIAAQAEAETCGDPAAIDRSETLRKIQGVGAAYAKVLAAVMDFPLAKISASDAVTAATRGKVR